jgi:hypothetical protein
MKTEIFMIVQNRKDGKLPDPVKAMYTEGTEPFYFIEETAHEAVQLVNIEYDYPVAGVYRGTIELEERCIKE